MNGAGNTKELSEALKFLDLHRSAYFDAADYADRTGHPNPSDSRAWSQILISLLTNLNGLSRKKGPDLEDGSDVKAANTWNAIDTPRFNGVIKAGTKSEVSGNMGYLDEVPYLFLVLWDHKTIEPDIRTERCRIWVVSPQRDPQFRDICSRWYEKRDNGSIGSDNFQLHPPRGKDHNRINNTCGNLDYPLFLSALWNAKRNCYEKEYFNPDAMASGECTIPE